MGLSRCSVEWRSVADCLSLSGLLLGRVTVRPCTFKYALLHRTHVSMSCSVVEIAYGPIWYPYGCTQTETQCAFSHPAFCWLLCSTLC